MDHVTSKEGNYDSDLEKGGVSSERESSKSLAFGTFMMKQLFSKAIGSTKGKEMVVSSIGSNCIDGLENVKLNVDKKAGEGGKRDVSIMKIVKEKPKAMSAKKPPKPPRPPRGLSLDSADEKLIRELHQLAKLKRARIKRMKALTKAKEAKAASSKNQLFATLLTVLLCLVVLLQGISSRTSSVASFQRSPMSSGLIEGSVVPFQKYLVSLTSDVNRPVYESPRLVARVSGTDTPQQVGQAQGD